MDVDIHRLPVRREVFVFPVLMMFLKTTHTAATGAPGVLVYLVSAVLNFSHSCTNACVSLLLMFYMSVSRDVQ